MPSRGAPRRGCPRFAARGQETPGHFGRMVLGLGIAEAEPRSGLRLSDDVRLAEGVAPDDHLVGQGLGGADRRDRPGRRDSDQGCGEHGIAGERRRSHGRDDTLRRGRPKSTRDGATSINLVGVWHPRSCLNTCSDSRTIQIEHEPAGPRGLLDLRVECVYAMHCAPPAVVCLAVPRPLGVRVGGPDGGLEGGLWSVSSRSQRLRLS